MPRQVEPSTKRIVHQKHILRENSHNLEGSRLELAKGVIAGQAKLVDRSERAVISPSVTSSKLSKNGFSISAFWY